MRLPKRGFSNFAHRVSYLAVDVAKAAKSIKGEITVEALVAAGLAHEGQRIKLVGGKAAGSSTVDRKLSVRVNRVSGAVKAAIESAGGTVVELDLQEQAAADASAQDKPKGAKKPAAPKSPEKA
jgi:large subunit ribosomal protein L15